MATVQGDRTTGILDRIVQSRRASLERFRAAGKAGALRTEAERAPAPRDFRMALQSPGVTIIAECKQRSPSAGVLQDPYDPVALARWFVDASSQIARSWGRHRQRTWKFWLSSNDPR